MSIFISFQLGFYIENVNSELDFDIQRNKNMQKFM